MVICTLKLSRWSKERIVDYHSTRTCLNFILLRASVFLTISDGKSCINSITFSESSFSKLSATFSDHGTGPA